MQTTIIDSARRFTELADAWRTSFSSDDGPSLSRDWFVACAETIHFEDRLYSVAITANSGELLAVAPMVLSGTRLLPHLQFLGMSTLYEPGGLHYRSRDALQTLLSCLLRQPYPIVLARLPERQRDDVLRGMAVAEFGGRLRLAKSPPSAYIPLRGSWDEYFASLSSRRRYDYRRNRKRLEALGAVTFNVECPTPATLPGLLDRAAHVESSGWKGRQRSGLAANGAVRRFFDRYLLRASRDGKCRIFFLEVGGRPVATQISIIENGRLWVLKIGYDEGLAKCSPGIQLTMDCVRYALGQGLEAYEFLGCDENWLHIWTDRMHYYYTLYLYPRSPHGLAALARDTARAAAGHLAGRRRRVKQT